MRKEVGELAQKIGGSPVKRVERTKLNSDLTPYFEKLPKPELIV
jgi:hypothetical protein